MTNDWQEMDNAPLNEPVLVCAVNCELVTAVQEEFEDPADKRKKVRAWFLYPKRWVMHFSYPRVEKPKMWQPLPFPPKHLYERKLVADALEKQVAELRA